MDYYKKRHVLGDETIPGFLGGRTPDKFPELYRRISPFYEADKIVTPLLLIVGEKDSRYIDTKNFYDALRKVGRPVGPIVYPNEGHEISDTSLAAKHVARAIKFFIAAQRCGGFEK